MTIPRSRRANWRMIHARVDLVAHERDLSEAEVRTAKIDHDAVVDFAYQNDLSFEWLIFGNLRALRDHQRFRVG